VQLVVTDASGQKSEPARVTIAVKNPSPSAPTLITPINNVKIQQNDPSTGCTLNPTRGYGTKLSFDWTDVNPPAGLAGYQLYVKRKGASLPLIDTFTSNSEFTKVSCDSFIADSNLLDWEWTVQTEDSQGTRGPVSAVGVFQFAPCQLEDGSMCR
jgi:hypothetical protein